MMVPDMDCAWLGTSFNTVGGNISRLLDLAGCLGNSQSSIINQVQSRDHVDSGRSYILSSMPSYRYIKRTE